MTVMDFWRLGGRSLSREGWAESPMVRVDYRQSQGLEGGGGVWRRSGRRRTRTGAELCNWRHSGFTALFMARPGEEVVGRRASLGWWAEAAAQSGALKGICTPN